MDIVERLRKNENFDTWNGFVSKEAADEIERLREKLGWMELAVSFYAKTQWWDQGRVARAALKEIE